MTQPVCQGLAGLARARQGLERLPCSRAGHWQATRDGSALPRLPVTRRRIESRHAAPCQPVGPGTHRGAESGGGRRIETGYAGRQEERGRALDRPKGPEADTGAPAAAQAAPVARAGRRKRRQPAERIVFERISFGVRKALGLRCGHEDGSCNSGHATRCVRGFALFSMARSSRDRTGRRSCLICKCVKWHLPAPRSVSFARQLRFLCKNRRLLQGDRSPADAGAVRKDGKATPLRPVAGSLVCRTGTPLLHRAGRETIFCQAPCLRHASVSTDKGTGPASPATRSGVSAAGHAHYGHGCKERGRFAVVFFVAEGLRC